MKSKRIPWLLFFFALAVRIGWIYFHPWDAGDSGEFGDALRSRDWLVIGTKILFIGGNLLILILAAIGAYFAGSRLMINPLFWSPLLFLLLAHLPSWIEARYILPLQPIVLILAGTAISKRLFNIQRPR